MAADELLEGAPVALWINLERSPERRARMEAELGALGLRHQRVEAVDGADLQGYAARHGVRVVPHPSGSRMENGCAASHVLALLNFLVAFPDEPRALVLEDDASFEYMPYWRKPLAAYLDEAAAAGGPGIVQLAVMLADPADVAELDPERAVPRPRPNWFSTAAYAIERPAAEAIVRRLCRHDGPQLVVDLSLAPCTVHADILLYSMAPTRTVPLVTFTCDRSYIHPDHLPHHVRHRRNVTDWWEAGSLARCARSDPATRAAPWQRGAARRRGCCGAARGLGRRHVG